MSQSRYPAISLEEAWDLIHTKVNPQCDEYQIRYPGGVFLEKLVEEPDSFGTRYIIQPPCILPEEPKLIAITSSIETIEGKFHVVKTAVVAPHDVPARRTSIMDGYAMRLPLRHRCPYMVVGEVRAGDGYNAVIQYPDTCVYITTGAAVPDGYDVVVPIELCIVASDPRTSQKKILLSPAVRFDAWKHGRNIREIGSDHKEWDVLLPEGQLIGPGEIGVLASIGKPSFEVRAPTRIGLIISGNEIYRTLPHSNEVEFQVKGSNEIFDSNGPMLHSLLSTSRSKIIGTIYVEDSLEETERAIRDLANCDLIVCSGGVSMGDSDFVKPALESVGEVIFGRLAVKPGLPTTFGLVRNKPVFALPGNPASAFVMAHLLVLPCIRRLQADSVDDPHGSNVVQVELCNDIHASPDGRLEFQRCTVFSPEGGSFFNLLATAPQTRKPLMAATTGNQRSSRVASLINVNALLVVPSCLKSGVQEYKKGSLLSAIMIGPLSAIPPPDVGTSNGVECSCGINIGDKNNLSINTPREPVPTDVASPRLHSSHLHAKEDKTDTIIKAGVLVISDRVSRGEAQDASGAAIVSSLQTNQVHPSSPRVCPDDEFQIRGNIVRICNEGHQLIVSTGGTGLGCRDVTPQAVSSLLSHRCNGLEHLIFNEGLQQTPFASLTRCVVGVIGTAVSPIGKRHLLVCLPGSPKAVKEALSALSPVLLHALRLLQTE